jgi:hypothetical protein
MLSPIILAVLIISTCNAVAQKVSKDYFIGKWRCVDSSTGKKERVKFKKNNTIYFYRSKWLWTYLVQQQDSVVSLKYHIDFKHISFDDEGTIVVQDENCLWWFNPLEYTEYKRRLQNGYGIAHKDEFDSWVKRARQVYYRKKDRKRTI